MAHERVEMTPEEAGPAARPARGWRRGAATAAVLLALVLASAAARVATALDDPGFQRRDPVGLLRSDPALLFYLTQRVVEAPGAVPDDWHADPRIEHPDELDVPREFTVGQELLLGWTYRALGRPGPLHLFCTVAGALLASAAAVGVWLLARAATGSSGWGLVAAGLFALTPANYRTIGFVLMREDLSLPLLAAHLGAALHAARRGGARAFAAAGVLGGLALATWHAAGFFLALAWLPAAGWSLRTGRGPLRRPGAWALVTALAAVALLVPVLRAKGAVLSLPVALLAGLALADRLPRGGRAARAAVIAGVPLGAALLRRALGRGGAYDHVLELVVSKLVYLGQLPPDPRALSFDARLLWQGPFATSGGFDAGAPGPWLALLALGAVAVAALRAWRRGADGRLAVLGGATLLGALAALLVRRAWVLPGLVGPAALVLLLRSCPRPRAASAAVLALAALAQGVFLAGHELLWYRPLERADAVRALVERVEEVVPPDAAIAADFVNGPTLLAHTGRPIVLQPKYEAGASRPRARAFLEGYFDGEPAAFHRLLTEELGARYLLVDRVTLDVHSAYVAGVPPGRGPRPGTAFELLARGASEAQRAAGFHPLTGPGDTGPGDTGPGATDSGDRRLGPFRLYALGAPEDEGEEGAEEP